MSSGYDAEGVPAGAVSTPPRQAALQMWKMAAGIQGHPAGGARCYRAPDAPGVLEVSRKDSSGA